jgi:hypothetical protein
MGIRDEARQAASVAESRLRAIPVKILPQLFLE